MSNGSPWPWFWSANLQWNSQNPSSSGNSVNVSGHWTGSQTFPKKFECGSLPVQFFGTGKSLNAFKLKLAVYNRGRITVVYVSVSKDEFSKVLAESELVTI